MRKDSVTPTILSPFNKRRRASTFSFGQFVKFAMVRLRIFLPSLHPSLSRMAGRELRFGTVSIYMATYIQYINHHVKLKLHITWEYLYFP
ncbi:MAG: hypothetical protein DRN37_05115 [Thermoplasmata archaeon]|nr:MAG: hypothetical protein DRN37_05115 [Thermoplasmata archaeon]